LTVRAKHTAFLVGPKHKGTVATVSRGIRHFEIDGTEVTLVQKKPIIIEFEHADNDKALREKLVSFLSDKIEDREQWMLVRAPFAANQYYPRIHRPIYSGPTDLHMRNNASHLKPPINLENASGAIFQLASLINSVRSIFQVVNPDSSNLETYGIEIRNLLIAASTEFEAQCKGVMKANGHQRKKWNTNEYVKLLGPMKLSDYTVKISPYAKIKNRRPFDGWNSDTPTESLKWYDAYNATKHDREVNFHLATLENAIDAVAACAIMLFAQYGRFPVKDPIVDYMVSIVEKPNWPSLRSYSKIGYSESDWESISYQF